jgi:hypothetical protein
MTKPQAVIPFLHQLQDGPGHLNRPYYPQTHAYNAALLAGWGAGVHLLLHDLDEWLLLPGGGSIQQALAPRGCLAEAAQARIDRQE